MVIIPLLLIIGGLGGTLWKVRKRAQLLERQVQQTEHLRQGMSKQLHETIILRDALLQIVDDALLVMNSKHQILFVNPAAEKLLGDNLVGQTLIRATRQHELESLLQEAREEITEIPEQRIELNGRNIQARASITSPTEPVTFELMALRDMTEVIRLSRARRDMVANISHELRTPVTAIGLLIDTLLNGAIDKPRRSKKMLTDARYQLDTLTQLVEEMRDLSRIESGQMPIILMPTPLTAIVEGSVDPLRPLAERKQLNIVIEIPPNVCVLADLQPIQRALKNIVHNAVKFTPEGGQIKLYVIVNEEDVTVAVNDNGAGIPAEDLPRIFERFFQADRSRHEGTGLGLAIARHIILAHSGRIWVESKESQGATFFFTLPQVETEAVSSTEST